MPDPYGRPTFNDGFQIAQGIRLIQRDQREEAQRMVDQDAFQVADMLYKSKGEADLSGFKPEARIKGSKLYWEQSVADIEKQVKEKQLSNEGLQLKINQFKEKQIALSEQFKVYQSMRKAGNESAARDIGREIFNQLPNGRYVEPKDGKLNITNWDHSTETIDDLPIKQYDQIIGSYFQMKPEEILDMNISGDTLRSKTNAKIIAQAERWFNPKTGKVAHLVPAGTWDPNGKPLGAYFIDSPVSQKQLSPEEAKGYVPLDVAKATSKKDDKIDPKLTFALDVIKSTKPKTSSMSDKIVAQDYGIPLDEEESPDQKALRDAATEVLNQGLGVKKKKEPEPQGIKAEKPVKEAPQKAIEHLKKHPELKEDFKAKYGYLPKGI